jgi:hypothetical protein
MKRLSIDDVTTKPFSSALIAGPYVRQVAVSDKYNPPSPITYT